MRNLFSVLMVVVLLAFFRTMVVQLVNRSTFPTTKQLILMNSVPPNIMRIRRSPSTPHNTLDVEGVNQNRVIQGSNPTRIQRLTIENVDSLQESQSLQPLQPSRLVNIRWDISSFRSLTK